MTPEQNLPTGCVVVILVVLLALAAYFTLAEFARALVWIRWAFG